MPKTQKDKSQEITITRGQFKEAVGKMLGTGLMGKIEQDTNSLAALMTKVTVVAAVDDLEGILFDGESGSERSLREAGGN